MKPLLSICIPTYNRSNWLRSSLWNWLPQVAKTDGLVELIVSDNASTDSTKQIIEEAKIWGEFTYYSNSENVGMIRNIYRLVKDFAQGQFVWVVGDDDLASPNSISTVVKVLKKCQNINYVYVNYAYWHPKKDDINLLLESTQLDFSNLQSYDTEIKIVDKVAKLVSIDHNCFTPIYCSIIRKQYACIAFEQGLNQEMFSSVASAVPHAFYIANNFLKQQCWYIGEPCILASYDVSWKENFPVYFIKLLPSLYRTIELKGGNPDDIKNHKKKILGFVLEVLNSSRSRSDISLGNKITLTFKTYCNYPSIDVFKNDFRYAKHIVKRIIKLLLLFFPKKQEKQ